MPVILFFTVTTAETLQRIFLTCRRLYFPFTSATGFRHAVGGLCLHSSAFFMPFFITTDTPVLFAFSCHEEEKEGWAGWEGAEAGC